MRDQGSAEEWSEESNQTHGGRFFPFGAEDDGVELGAGQECQDDSAGACQKRDPFGLGAEGAAAGKSADHQLGDRANDNLGEGG